MFNGDPPLKDQSMNEGVSVRRWKEQLTNFYRCTNGSIFSGCITAWYGNCSTYNRKALQRVVRSAERITGGKLPALQDTYNTWCHRKIIKDTWCQKDHQGQQPSEPLPFHPAVIQKARSVQVHQSWDRESEKQLLSQGHQTVKQPPLTLSGCCQHTDSTPATLIMGIDGNWCKIYH